MMGLDSANDRILIVDDNPDIHADFRKILGGRSSSSDAMDRLERQMLGESGVGGTGEGGFDLIHAHQGKDGYELFRNAKEQGSPFFAAFIDMRMPPGWDGLETIQAIRKIDNEVTLVVCTAYSDHSWDDIAKNSGDCDKLLFLKKPFDPVEVQALARSLQERWALLKKAYAKTHQLEEMVRLRTRELEAERSKDKMRMEILEEMVAERTAELREMAMTDSLTGLPNRIQFCDRMLTVINESREETARAFAVMYLDFDRFKFINDNFGHDIGDKFLKLISERLTAILSDEALFKGYPDAEVLPARLGGDEFCVLIQGVPDRDKVVKAGERVLSILDDPCVIETNAVQSTVSVGLTFSDIGYDSAEEVLRDADTAMYTAKSGGGGVRSYLMLRCMTPQNVG